MVFPETPDESRFTALVKIFRQPTKLFENLIISTRVNTAKRNVENQMFCTRKGREKNSIGEMRKYDVKIAKKKMRKIKKAVFDFRSINV